MPDGMFDHDKAFAHRLYVEKGRSKETEPKNFFEQKRRGWMDTLEDQQTASEIAQSIRAVLFEIPEADKPRTQEETQKLYEGIEEMVRIKMWGMELPGAYGTDFRHAAFSPEQQSKLFVFINHDIPSYFHDRPMDDLKCLKSLMSTDVHIFSRMDDVKSVLTSSDRLGKYTDVMVSESDHYYPQSILARKRQTFIDLFSAIFQPPKRLFGFHPAWNPDPEDRKAREQAYEKAMVEHEALIKDQVFFDACIKTLSDLILQNSDGNEVLATALKRFSQEDQEEKREFIRQAQTLHERGILFSDCLSEWGHLKHADASKDGLAMFPKEQRTDWLSRCFWRMLTGSDHDFFSRFVREAIARPTTTASAPETMPSTPSLPADEMTALREYATTRIQNELKSFFGGSVLLLGSTDLLVNKLGEEGKEIIRAFDQSFARGITDTDMKKFVSALDQDALHRHFPTIFAEVMLRIESLAGEDEDVGQAVLMHFERVLDQPWAERIARQFAQEVETAKSLYQKCAELPIRDKYPWIKDVMEEMEQLYSKIVLQPPELTDHIRGFMETDPFEKHPHRFGGSSMGLGDVFSGRKTPEELKLDLTPEAKEFLQEANRILEEEHQRFLDQINASGLVPPEDKIALANPGQSLVKMNDVKDSVRVFLGRFIVQTTFGRLNRLKPDAKKYASLRAMIQDGYKKYLDVYATDIPLYDKLYEEFDALRETGRSPLEVYLGRDGIYAYIGRKAQDATRKAILGREKVEALRTEGELVAIEPKYLVYPSFVRDIVRKEAKQEYLAYHGVTKDADPFFYDTGYSGSIPEQIMGIMGFERAEIEERIRLLSAKTDKRRMRGISANANEEVIEQIEENPKSEESATGLVKNPETGQIAHSAEPTSPEDQFSFSLIRQAIARHYLIQEKLHYEVPENTILDSETFTLRIRSEYAEQIPDAFKTNPIAFLETQGTPEDGAVLITLKDGTEVMARRVEWTKTKQAQTEYAILISAKKAGVPAAEPVGFVTGKSAEDESVILSKKIEGVPGKRFEKTLRDSGKYSENQIAKLMQELQGQIEAVTTLLKQTLNITGNWRVNDVAVQFNDETGVIERVIPLKWEQVKRRDEEKEKRVMKLIQKSGYEDNNLVI